MTAARFNATLQHVEDARINYINSIIFLILNELFTLRVISEQDMDTFDHITDISQFDNIIQMWSKR